MDKKEQAKLITEIMEADAKDGLYTLSQSMMPNSWSIEFTWKDKSAKITLANGEDLLKIAQLLSDVLKLNGIENNLETK